MTDRGVCMSMISRQEKEDYLETMYLLKRRENQITRADLVKHLGVSVSRVNRVVAELLEEGYLLRDEKHRLYLTTIGVNKGREYLEKHRCLTEFLLLLSGVDQEMAERNACRIEHIIDEEIYLGIRMFMENRHVFSYTMKDNDLNFLFPHGMREMPIAIYVKDSRYPRILAEEYRLFAKKAKVVIGEESYLYLLPETKFAEDTGVYYWYAGQWQKARRGKWGYGILTEALECHIHRSEQISEGKVLIQMRKEEREAGREPCVLAVSLI